MKDFICIVKLVSGVFLGSAVSTRPAKLICLEDVLARLPTPAEQASHKGWKQRAGCCAPGGCSAGQPVPFA